MLITSLITSGQLWIAIITLVIYHVLDLLWYSFFPQTLKPMRPILYAHNKPKWNETIMSDEQRAIWYDTNLSAEIEESLKREHIYNALRIIVASSDLKLNDAKKLLSHYLYKLELPGTRC